MLKFKRIFCIPALFSFLLTIMLVSSLFLWVSSTNADQSSITVQAIVAGCGNNHVDAGEECDLGVGNAICPSACSVACKVNDCMPGPGDPGGDAFPTIANVVPTVLGPTSAKIAWTSGDDKAGFIVKLEYGLTNNYGTVAFNAQTNGETVTLNNLLPNTKYFYRLTNTDSSNQVTTVVGDFTTNPAVVNLAILNKDIQNVNQTSATVVWNTNKVARGEVLWGRTNQYGGTVTDNDLTQNKSLVILNLIANTTYHYKIVATDADGNSVQTADDVFVTAKNDGPVPDVTDFKLVVGNNGITLTWVNPRLANVPDFVGVKMLRKVGGASANKDDGFLVYEGAGENFVNNVGDGAKDIKTNVNYFYTIFSYNTSDEYSPGVFKNGEIVPQVPPVEICDNNNIDDDGDGLADCADLLDCANFPACKAAPPGGGVPEICNNGVDDDGDGKIDCADPDCVVVCQPPPGGLKPEVCDNQIDDDGDGKIDCMDSDCGGFPACANQPKPIELEPIKPAPTSTVPAFAKIQLVDLLFLGGNRQINLTRKNGEIINLAGYNTAAGVSKKSLTGPFEKMVLVEENGAAHQFIYNPVADTYFADFIFPGAGAHNYYITVDYGNGQIDTVNFVLRGLSSGRVTGKGGVSVDGIKVTLLDNKGVVLNVNSYGEKNPIITDSNGLYGWLVPNGQYFILLQKDGYYDRKVPARVENNVINSLLELTIKPPPLKIDTTKSVAENIQNVAQNLTEQVGTIGQVATEVVADLASNPGVQKSASQVVAPAAVGVVAVGVVSMVSWSSLAAFLQFILFQPLAFVGRKKREKWGQVYNSLNKLPVDLAVVRLIDAKTGRLMQSRVTDTKGRYIFDAKPGEYRIVASREKFVFPSSLLKDFKTDGERVDIYHGETIRVDKNHMILTVNIPLDPVGAGELPKRLRLQRILHSAQLFLSWTGLFITAGAFYISRQWYVGVLLVVNLLVLVAARRLVGLKKPKGWGIVYDVSSKKPISRVVARLFDSQFNKLVATQVTDSQGRYYFLAGGNKYYVTYSHENYTEKKTDIIDTGMQKNDLIALNIALQKVDQPKR